jgi:hypothetical protein
MLIVHVALKLFLVWLMSTTRTEIFTHSSVRVAKLMLPSSFSEQAWGSVPVPVLQLWMGHGL